MHVPTDFVKALMRREKRCLGQNKMVANRKNVKFSPIQRKKILKIFAVKLLCIHVREHPRQNIFPLIKKVDIAFVVLNLFDVHVFLYLCHFPLNQKGR